MRWHVLASVVLVVALPSTGFAQKEVVPGTGCPGAAAPLIVSGAPVTGSFVTLTVPPSEPYVSGLCNFTVGTALPSPIIFDPPISCVPGCSFVCVGPTVGGPTVTVQVPPGLVGQMLCTQIQCLTPAGCTTLSLVRNIGIVQ